MDICSVNLCSSGPSSDHFKIYALVYNSRYIIYTRYIQYIQNGQFIDNYHLPGFSEDKLKGHFLPLCLFFFLKDRSFETEYCHIAQLKLTILLLPLLESDITGVCSHTQPPFCHHSSHHKILLVLLTNQSSERICLSTPGTLIKMVFTFGLEHYNRL